jgi:GNAT superfamily N-acetyltransferase
MSTTGKEAVSPITYRNATGNDIEAEHAVFVAAEGELLRRHGFGWSTPPPIDRFAPGHHHLLAHDGQRCFVAESDGRVVGYSAVIVREEASFLAALFVDPGSQGVGVGRKLFALAFAEAPARRMTISDAIQPISNALYARNGLLPATPILGFEGHPSNIEPSDLEASRPAADALAVLDRAAYGFDRSVDHAFWAAQASPTLWLRNGEPVAYSYRWPTGRVGPIAGKDEASAAAALWAEVGREPSLHVEIPGTCRSLVRVALAAGLRLTAPVGLLLLSDGIEAPHSLAISSYGLM